LTINPPALTGITLSPTTLLGGGSAGGAVTISPAAPVGGLTIALSSSNSAASVPASLNVAAGATSAQFTVTTLAVAQQVTATVSASLASSSLGVGLTITPPVLSAISLNPASLSGGTSSVATVTLSGPAPASGFTITLSSDQKAATVPGTVKVGAGASSATFTITTTGVGSQTVATISGADPNGQMASAQLTIKSSSMIVVQVPVSDITFDPISGNIWAAVQSTGGKYANCVVSIDPASGSIGTSINIGATPNHVRVTDNGAYAYVDVPADGSVRRANLKTGLVDGIYSIHMGGVFDLETVPGSPNAYVIVQDPTGGVNTTVWDGATPRNNTGAGGYRVQFAGNGSLLYGDGRGSLFINTLSSTQIDWTQQLSLNVSGFQYANGLLYTAVPTVVDPVGQYVVQSLPTTDFYLLNVEVAVNSSENRIYYVSWDADHSKRILDFDMTTYEEKPFFDDSSGLPGGCSDLIACGNHTVAFYLYGSGVTRNVVIVHGLQ
ncbi:MAG: hypothetical protein P4L46_02405, partial [Fimbriimonas sp.]|nr:hypothetical protein [Fimbriimonas sp.]